MQIVAVKDKRELGRKAAKVILEVIHKKPDAVLGLATGGTPEETYKELVKDHRENGTSYKAVRTVNLDEYVGIDPSDPNSYHSYMDHNFFKYIDLPEDQHFLPDSLATTDHDCARYDDLIDSLGGVDLQLLGIGGNGHIGFNEPGTPLSIGTHVVQLTDSTRKANARYFSSLSEVPEQAITMGIGTILKSKKVLLIVSGEEKAEAMYKLVRSSVPESGFPASALIQHPDVTVIADRSALSLIKLNKD
ncbi:glucosamine-6-phosphate deaminase [Sporolactobacillus sp. CPB3-1]|uniref:Glucosamine-6-phosphate deaminase n=1 Tax=Sporolactobacillus mangiferae TaxID=2940498 RepID=A0ABT0MA93_9BACL|nr:glucosamine-6-phosphate deaminase [Sporolactobacillus mangiferae]MCL1631796.1 glucosamine-6-phosphate deaminase [Sporolactobacillus mangiferae]